MGNTVQFMPKYIPASGTVIDIDVSGKTKTARSSRNARRIGFATLARKSPWTAIGCSPAAVFWTDESTGKKHYQAESGDFICVSNFSTAMLDLPVESTQHNDALMFEALTENIPPLGTPVTIVLKPRLSENKK